MSNKLYKRIHILPDLQQLSLFLEYPTKEFSIRDVANEINVSPMTARSMLKNFMENTDPILKRREFKNAILYSANRESFDYRFFKIYHNIKKIRKSGLIEKLNEFYGYPTIVLFGSASRGEDMESSDIDLYVASEKIDEFDANVYERRIGRSIHIINAKTISDIGNPHLANNIINGIVIEGELIWT